MAIYILIIGTILLLISSTIDSLIRKGDKLEMPMYVDNPLITTISILSGLVLPVFTWTRIFEYHWFFMILANLMIVFFLMPLITILYLKRFATGKGLGFDMIVTLVIGIILYTIGMIIS